MTDQYNVTSVGANPKEDRAHRMRFYFISMTLRFLCVASLLWVRGWWVLVPVLGAVILPYLAVMVGNAIASTGDSGRPERVTPQELPPPARAASDGDSTLIVIDAPADRRARGERIHDTDPPPGAASA